MIRWEWYNSADTEHVLFEIYVVNLDNKYLSIISNGKIGDSIENKPVDRCFTTELIKDV